MAKIRTNISITDETKERLIQYGFENHIPGGLSGAIEHIAWQVIKVRRPQIRGQMTVEEALRDSQAKTGGTSK